MDKLIYGSAYYDEYMPVDRIGEDVAMMRAANHTTVRIAESTWSTMEPQPGVFDFTYVDRAIDAMEAAGIDLPDDETPPDEDQVEKFREFLDQVSPEDFG